MLSNIIYIRVQTYSRYFMHLGHRTERVYEMKDLGSTIDSTLSFANSTIGCNVKLLVSINQDLFVMERFYWIL